MIIGVDAGITSYTEADALAGSLPARLSSAGDLAGIHTATHTVQVGDPRFVVTAFWPPGAHPAGDAVWTAVLAAVPGAGIVLTAPQEQDARTSGPDLAVLGAWVAATRIARGLSGRVVTWPGAAELTGRMPLAEALERGGLDGVEVIGGDPAGPDETFDPLGFVRPRWRADGCVLQVQRGDDGVLVPFEPEHLPR